MRVGVFNCNQHEIDILTSRNVDYGIEMTFFDIRLNLDTVYLAHSFDAVSISASDSISSQVLDCLIEYNIHHIALRCAGFNHIDIKHAAKVGISISRVPHYSQTSVAEHTLALILALNRKLYGAQHRLKDNNYDQQGLLGFDLRYATFGIIGTGQIGSSLINILQGFGAKILCSDPNPEAKITNQACEYVPLNSLLERSDIISLHCPLTLDTQHIIDYSAIQSMKPNVMIINTSRGGLMNMKAVISGLKSKKIAYLGIDIYEMESELDDQDMACTKVSDETFQRLLTFSNVLITSHHGCFTRESLELAADTVLKNLQYYFVGKVCGESFLL
jgi:D-lactate dehydrogenase